MVYQHQLLSTSCAAGGQGGGRICKKQIWETQGQQQQHPLHSLSSCKFIFIGLVVLLKGAEIHSASLSFVSYQNILHQHSQCPLPVQMSNGGK